MTRRAYTRQEGVRYKCGSAQGGWLWPMVRVRRHGSSSARDSSTGASTRGSRRSSRVHGCSSRAAESAGSNRLSTNRNWTWPGGSTARRKPTVMSSGRGASSSRCSALPIASRTLRNGSGRQHESDNGHPRSCRGSYGGCAARWPADRRSPSGRPHGRSSRAPSDGALCWTGLHRPAYRASARDSAGDHRLTARGGLRHARIRWWDAPALSAARQRSARLTRSPHRRGGGVRGGSPQ